MSLISEIGDRGYATRDDEVFASSVEYLQTLSRTFLSTVKEKLNLIYLTSLKFLDSVEQHDKFMAFRSVLLAKSNEFIEILKSHQINIKFIANINQFKAYYKEVSRQAIIFGCGGLLTGALIGICVGYNVRYSNQVSNSSLMRAVLLTNSRKGIDGITLSVMKTPSVVNSDDVLIQVRAVGIDMIDAEIANGYAHQVRHQLGMKKVREPMVLGRECSGVVVDLGNQVQSLEINDRVWAYLPVFSGLGFMSEYVVVPQKFVGLKPNNISFEAAATMPYAFITFFQQAQLDPAYIKNKRILIHLGLSSKNDGVGLLATQLLKSWGGRVTISTEEEENQNIVEETKVAQMTFLHSLKTLGAQSHLILPKDHSQISNLAQRLFDVVINTECSRLSPILSNFCKNPSDKVIETFSLEVSSKCFSSILNMFMPSQYFQEPWKKEDKIVSLLNECKKMVESRMLSPIVAKSFLPSQYDQAFRHVSKSNESALAQANIGTVGKCVLVFKPSTFY